MRVPRVILGLIVGAGLSMSGSVMQSTVNNPIAEPYILGISAGATFGATLAIILGLKAVVGLGAFVGAILATVLVLIIASMQGRVTTSGLILSGTVVNALFIAFANFIISIGATADSVMTINYGFIDRNILVRFDASSSSGWFGLSLFLNSVSCLQCHDDGR